MFIIPGEVIAAATFPGVIVHEAAHMLFCRLCRIPVFEVCFFRFGNPAGYVIHAPTKSFIPTLLITVGPFLLNSLLCIFFCFPAFVPVRIFDQQNPVLYFLIWLGVSIGMHAFPSDQDAKVLWNEGLQAMKRFNPLGLISLPIVAIICLANLGRFIWLDLAYGVAIGLGLPELVFKHLL